MQPVTAHEPTDVTLRVRGDHSEAVNLLEPSSREAHLRVSAVVRFSSGSGSTLRSERFRVTDSERFRVTDPEAGGAYTVEVWTDHGWQTILHDLPERSAEAAAWAAFLILHG